MMRKYLGILLLVAAAFGAGLVASRFHVQAQSSSLDQRSTVNSIPKEYGRLAGVVNSEAGQILYFEASDGTIRVVVANYGLDYGTLKFRAIAVPRS